MKRNWRPSNVTRILLFAGARRVSAIRSGLEWAGGDFLAGIFYRSHDRLMLTPNRPASILTPAIAAGCALFGRRANAIGILRRHAIILTVYFTIVIVAFGQKRGSWYTTRVHDFRYPESKTESTCGAEILNGC